MNETYNRRTGVERTNKALNDTSAFEPLVEEFDERYDTEKLQAALADAGFDS